MNDSKVPLEILDPARRDPNYWGRFQDRVMKAAAPELARRRARGEVVTVSDLVLSWGRLLVPSALLAATVAGILMVPRPDFEPVAAMGVEEVLRALVNESLPDFLERDDTPDPVLIRVALEGG